MNYYTSCIFIMVILTSEWLIIRIPDSPSLFLIFSSILNPGYIKPYGIHNWLLDTWSLRALLFMNTRYSGLLLN